MSIFVVGGWGTLTPPPTVIHGSGTNNFTSIKFYDSYDNGTHNLSGYATIDYNFENETLNIFSEGTTSDNNSLLINGIVYGTNFCVNGTCLTDLNGSNTSNYVPYTGATNDVDLGDNELTTGKLNLGTGRVLEAGAFDENTTLFFKSNLNTGDNAFRVAFAEQEIGGVPTSGGYIQYNSDANYLEFGGIENDGTGDVPGFRIARDTGKATYVADAQFDGDITGALSITGQTDFTGNVNFNAVDIYGSPTFNDDIIIDADLTVNDHAYLTRTNSHIVQDSTNPAYFNINGPSNGVDSSTLGLYESGGTAYGMYMKYDGDANYGYIGMTNGGVQNDVFKFNRAPNTQTQVLSTGFDFYNSGSVDIKLDSTDSDNNYIKTASGFNRVLTLGPRNAVVDDGAYIEFTSSATDGYGAQIGGIREDSSAGNALVFRTGENNQQERMRISNNGDITIPNTAFFSAGGVGIGTISPSGAFEVNGGPIRHRVDGDDSYISLYNAGVYEWTYGMDASDNNIKFTRGGTFGDNSVLTIDESSHVGINTEAPQRDLAISSPSTTYLQLTNEVLGETAGEGFEIAVDTSGNTVIINREAASMYFRTDDTNRMVIANDGDIGIGGITPSKKLEVSGTAGYNSVTDMDSSDTSFTSKEYVDDLFVDVDADTLDGFDSSEIYKHEDIIMNTNPFGGNILYNNVLNNAYFRAPLRWVVTGAIYNSTTNASIRSLTNYEKNSCFDGNYDTAVQIPAGTHMKLNINFSTETDGYFPGYPYAHYYVSHYHTYFPDESITNTDTIRVHTNYTPHVVGWHEYNLMDFTRDTYLIQISPNVAKYKMGAVEFTLHANSTDYRKVSQIDVRLRRPGRNEMPFVDKYTDNILYNKLTFEDGTNTPIISLNPYTDTFFNNGNVGIGTDSPEELLEISTGAGATARITSTGDGLGADQSIGKLEFYGNDASSPGAGVKAEIHAVTDAVTGDDAALDFYVSDGTTNRNFAMRISPEGNVGIGTNSPEYLLQVDGNASVDKLKIENTSMLTTPLPGTLEFSDDRMYVTNVGHARAIDRTSDVALTSTNCQNTVAETTMWTGEIGADDLKVGNILKVIAHGQISSASASDVLTLRFYIGGTEIASIDSPGKALSSDCWTVEFDSTIRSVGSSGVIGRYLKMSIEDNSNTVCGTTTIDTTTSNNLTITAQWNNAKAENTFGLGLGWLEFKN